MSKGLNWKGVAKNLTRIKNLSEPNYFEKLEHKAYVENIEEEIDRKYDATVWKFDEMYSAYNDTQTDLQSAYDDLDSISKGLAGLHKNPESLSNPHNVLKLVTQNDKSNIQHLNKMTDEITDEVFKDTQELERLRNIYDNAAFGSGLFSRQKNEFGHYIDEKGAKVYSWDLKPDGKITEDEMTKALEGTIRLMEMEHKEVFGSDSQFDSKGIREGFWAGYNKQDQVETELRVTDKINSLIDNGQAENSPVFKAALKSRVEFEKNKFDKVYDKELHMNEIDDLQLRYTNQKNAINDWDNEEGTGPAYGTENENPHWYFQTGGDDKTAGNYKFGPGYMAFDKWEESDAYDKSKTIYGQWKKTGDRLDIEKSNGDILTAAYANDTIHYFIDKNKQNFSSDDDNVIPLYIWDADGIESTGQVTFDDIGITNDFYQKFNKDFKIPIWQDTLREIDTNNDGVKDSSAIIQAHTAFFEEAEGKKWAMKFKREIEFIQQFLEDAGSLDEIVEESRAIRFNDAMDILWKAYPEHFEGKTKLAVNIEDMQDGSGRFYYVHDAMN